MKGKNYLVLVLSVMLLLLPIYRVFAQTDVTEKTRTRNASKWVTNKNIGFMVLDGNLTVTTGVNGVTNKYPVYSEYISFAEFYNYPQDSAIINIRLDSLTWTAGTGPKYGGRGSDSTGQHAVGITLTPTLKHPIHENRDNRRFPSDTLTTSYSDTMRVRNTGDLAGNTVRSTGIVDSILGNNIVHSFRVPIENMQYRLDIFFNWDDTSNVSDAAQININGDVSLKK